MDTLSVQTHVFEGGELIETVTNQIGTLFPGEKGITKKKSAIFCMENLQK